MKKNLKKIKAAFSKSRNKKQKANKSSSLSSNNSNNPSAEKKLVETENAFSEISKTTKISNIKESNNMTEPKNNPNPITNEQPSLTAGDMDTKEGNLNLANQVKGNNADLSSRRRSTGYSGTFNFSGSKSQNVLGSDNYATQNNNEIDNESRLLLELERVKRQRQDLENKAKSKLDKDGKKLLREILSIVRTHVKAKEDWKDGSAKDLLWEKIDNLEEKEQLANNEIEELCQVQAEETKLEMRQEALIAQQLQN